MFTIPIEKDFHLELLHLCHAKELIAVVDQNRAHLREWLPWLDSTQTEEDTGQFIKTTMQQYADNLGFQVALVLQGQIVGVSGYHLINKENHHAGLGYWLSKHHVGHGLMTKAVSKMVEIGFSQLELNKIMIFCASENKKSRSIPERLGFQKDGILRQHEWLYDHYLDHVVYSILKQEYKSD